MHKLNFDSEIMIKTSKRNKAHGLRHSGTETRQSLCSILVSEAVKYIPLEVGCLAVQPAV